MPNRNLILAVLAAMLVSMPVTFAQSGLEVMKKNDEQISSNDEKVKITMTLINDKGKQGLDRLNASGLPIKTTTGRA